MRSLPDVCILGTSCFNQKSDGESHRIGIIRREDYYLRFLNRSGQLIAFTEQLPEGLPPTARDTSQPQWHTLTDSDGTRYRQISLLLHTQDNRFWGYLQVGRSIKDFDDYLTAVRWIILLGLPIALFLVGICSWWLAGLAIKPIYQSYRQIQQFTADAAHELRTPLAAIRATIESTLRLNQLNESESRETLRVVGRQNYRLSQLVDALLLLCRMDRQELLSQQNAIAKNECVSLNDLLSDIAEELAPLAMAADVNLTTEMRVSQPLEIMGNEEQLYRLVSNLVTNGIQYTPADGKVILILDSYQHYALIQIQDTGIGIAPEDQKQIFDRFL
ncbi:MULTISPECIES: two-component system sensor histidine kinase RppB [unclassified Coleofasciculus]|uniref:two-component system sensor histidine kinase RppB n=1 Tax=unclassified Coleofasciculus TaxID=2692782 RepID=UPI002AD42780|nr:MULTISPECIES: two-component system sensor histidine kinase RppB [unclassified Coleofasciculus]